MNWPKIDLIKDGRVVVRDGFRLLLFLNRPHALLRASVEHALAQYASAIGHENLRLFIDPDGEVDSLDGSSLAELFTERFTADHESEGGLTLLSADVAIPDFQFRYYGEDIPDEHNPGLRNYIDCWFNSEFIRRLESERTLDLVLDIADPLPISSGYASPAMLYNQEVHEAAKRGLRYPGFDILDPAAARVDISNFVPGVYWVMFFGNEISSQIGGADCLRFQLPEEVRVFPMEHKFAIVLGAVPVVGDTNRRSREMDLYQSTARLLEPMLHEPGVTYICDEIGMPDREMQTRWHRRFLDAL